MSQTLLAALAPLIVVAVAFTLGIFAARRERMQRLTRSNRQETSRRAVST
jgi:hypothetical protein